MNKLNFQDLRFCVLRIPKNVRTIMQDKQWSNQMFIAGGFIRSVITNEKINDIDIFVSTVEKAELLAYKLCKDKKDIIKTDNAYTVRGNPCLQIIHRWVFNNAKDITNSFDFTICAAAIYCDVVGDNKFTYDSFCHQLFYQDLAAKRLTYMQPQRNEDAGGSMLRVLKYYQKGYRIPLDSLGMVIARLTKAFDASKIDLKNEFETSKIITGLLRQVDPNVDPTREAHLPSSQTPTEEIDFSEIQFD